MAEKKDKQVAVVQADERQAVGFAPTTENIELLKNTLGDVTLADNELQLFLYQAQRTGLDPLARQIYVLKDKSGRVSFMTSIDGQRLVAQRTDQYEGQVGPQWCGIDGIWKDVWLKNDAPAAARVGVYRSGFKEAVYGVATWKSYGRDVKIWREKGDVMLAKCAEALALRKAFPQELSGLYTPEEIDENQNAGQQARPMTIPEALKQAAKLLGDAGIESREDKLAIIMGVAEVEDINQMTGSKMKTVLAAIKTEDIDALRKMYLDDDVIEGEVVDGGPDEDPETGATLVHPEPITADNIDSPSRQQHDDLDDELEANMDLVDLAAHKAQKPGASWVIPDFKPSNMMRPEQGRLIKKWLEYLETRLPGTSNTFVLHLIGKEMPTTREDADTVLQTLADQLNDLAEKEKVAA